MTERPSHPPRLFVSTFPYALIKHARALGETLNGVTQVNVAPSGGGHFPANAPIAWCLTTVGGTAGTAAPYFSAAQIADQFSVKSPTAGANDVYAWQALPAPVTVSAANLDLYKSLRNPNTGAAFVSSS